MGETTPTVNPLRIGLVGCGMIGQIHADGLRKLVDDGEIVAVAAADPSAAARRAVMGNCPFLYESADAHDVIADPDVDAVMVASPTSTHRDLVLAVVAGGKALFCEKPLAPSLDDVTEICAAVGAAGVVAQVGFHARFHPVVNRIRDAVVSDELGRPMGYVLRDDQYWPTGDVVPGHSSWRSQRVQAGGGALLEHSIHSADLLCWLFGPVSAVFARTRSSFGYDVEDVAALTIEHESGVVGTLLTVFNGVRGREERRFEVFFEQGAIEATTDFIVGAPEDSLLLQRPDSPPHRPDLVELREEHFTGLGLKRRDFLFYTYPADRHWVHCVQAGRPPSPDLADALAAHRLVDAAYRSAAANSVVTL
jgi:predicted dehydrogenase